MLVGREEELAAIQHALDGLGGARQSQRSRFLEVVGDPGIGKTSLLDVLRAEAEARGWWTLRGCATEFETEVPLYALVDAMDDTLSGIRQSLSASLVSALGTVFPALFDFNAAAETTMRERYRLHRSIGQLLEHIAAAGPVVVILDDMQWADRALVNLLVLDVGLIGCGRPVPCLDSGVEPRPVPVLGEVRPGPQDAVTAQLGVGRPRVPVGVRPTQHGRVRVELRQHEVVDRRIGET